MQHGTLTIESGTGVRYTVRSMWETAHPARRISIFSTRTAPQCPQARIKPAIVVRPRAQQPWPSPSPVRPSPPHTWAQDAPGTQTHTQSCASKGIGRQGIGFFCKGFLCFNTAPCSPMPLLVRS